jgi:type IV pilus assembly protein PilQ
LVLRSNVKQEEMLMVNPTGAIIIPDARLNSLTVLGTAQQLDRVAQFLPTLDRPLPQIAFEVAVMELTDVNTRTMETALNGQLGEVSGGFNLGGGGRSVLDYTNNPIVNSNDLAFAVEALIQKNRIRLLANPSMTTLHDHEAIINIVDEVIQGFEQVVDLNGNNVALVPRLGNAGIILNLLPKLGPNGVINLRISPTVSFPQPSPFNDGVTLISRREILAQNVNLKDGQSFVLGGLIQDLDSTTVSKLPFLGDLPIVGALLRSTRNDSRRSELLITITPHLLTPGQAALPRASQVPAANRGQAYTAPPALRGDAGKAMPVLKPMPSYLAPANGQGSLRPVGSAESDALRQGVLGKYAAPANSLY